MDFYYLDTSALVKRYVREPGSTWVQELITKTNSVGAQANTIVIAEIGIIEIAAALALTAHLNRISQRDCDLAYRRFTHDTTHLYHLSSVATGDFHAAARLTQRRPLKAYNALQLAVALRHHQALARREHSLMFVSGDQQQLMAAEAEGLATDKPFDHLAPSDSPVS